MKRVMRIQTVHLTDFKRFSDLTLDLTARSTKIVALVGPNGSGKSSIFDAFEEKASLYKGRQSKKDDYFKKSTFSGSPSAPGYEVNKHVDIQADRQEWDRKSVYIRSAYRFTPRIDITNIRRLPDAEQDENRPKYLIEADGRLTENYERLIGQFFGDVYGKIITGEQWVNQNISSLNAVLQSVLDIQVSWLGNPVEGRGSLYFEKGTSKKFPYENLSAGEKEVVDIVLDIHVKKNIYVDSVICIDEPELHLNTAIQRKLLVEVEKLIPENSQLWVATHSIGFLRALQDELKDKTTIFDFTGVDFDSPATLRPIVGTRSDWSRIFATALEDLTGLLAPRRIVYCEGRPEPRPSGDEQGLDADVYNRIFQEQHADVLFVSSGGGGEVSKNALIALRILNKAIKDVTLGVLKDRDELSDADRSRFLAQDPTNRMLTRREIENYLFDKDVLKQFCATAGSTFDEDRYDAAVADVQTQDLKPVQQSIMAACGFRGSVPDFKRALAGAVGIHLPVYAELSAAIFP